MGRNVTEVPPVFIPAEGMPQTGGNKVKSKKVKRLRQCFLAEVAANPFYFSTFLSVHFPLLSIHLTQLLFELVATQIGCNDSAVRCHKIAGRDGSDAVCLSGEALPAFQVAQMNP